VAAAWQHDPSPADGDEQVRVAAYDAAGPRLSGLSVPARVEVGETARFGVGAVDVWSAVAGIDWSFGDGGSASGAQVTHVYSRSGQFPVGVTARDALGNARAASATVAVGEPRPAAPPAPPPAPPVPAASADLTPPVVSDLRPVRRCVRPGSGAPQFTFTLSEAATVRFVLRRRNGSPGRRRCPAPPLGRRPGTARLVEQQVRPVLGGPGTFAPATPARVRGARRLEAGRIRVRLTQARRLRPGTYQLMVRPTDVAGNVGPDAITKVWVLRR
jgi:hypothetical protein